MGAVGKVVLYGLAGLGFLMVTGTVVSLVAVNRGMKAFKEKAEQDRQDAENRFNRIESSIT